MRQMVYAALPLGEGIIADPFMGSGATIAAAEAVGVRAIGVERYRDYYEMACTSIPKLKAFRILAMDSTVEMPQPEIFKASVLTSVKVSINGRADSW